MLSTSIQNTVKYVTIVIITDTIFISYYTAAVTITTIIITKQQLPLLLLQSTLLQLLPLAHQSLQIHIFMSYSLRILSTSANTYMSTPLGYTRLLLM